MGIEQLHITVDDGDDERLHITAGKTGAGSLEDTLNERLTSSVEQAQRTYRDIHSEGTPDLMYVVGADRHGNYHIIGIPDHNDEYPLKVDVLKHLAVVIEAQAPPKYMHMPLLSLTAERDDSGEIRIRVKGHEETS